jgi:DNA-directed RNA polymerase specialized sigma24 family protein
VKFVSDSTPPDTTRAPVAFVTTQWTRVLEARGDSPEAQAALGDLCAAYYAPVLAFIRRGARDEDAARDLAQEFFARLLARRSLETVERGRGRFRSFLLGAVKHFLADQFDRSRAAKRGGGQTPLSLDAHAGDTTHGGSEMNFAPMQFADPAATVSDAFFDRQWALTILDLALAALAAEHHAAGKAAQFETLKPWLTGDSENLSQADAARQLDMNEGALKVAIHRLRKRFRELVKGEIAQTVGNGMDVQAELNYLLEVLSRAATGSQIS